MRDPGAQGQSLRKSLGALRILRSGRLSLALAMVLAGLNLRPAITGIAPAITELEAEYQIAPAFASLVIAFPVMLLGIGAPIGLVLWRRFPIRVAVAIALAAIAVGIAARSLSPYLLLPGSLVAGVGIAAVAVLLPSAVRLFGLRNVGLWTAIYGSCISLGAALAPLATGLLVDAGLSLRLAVLPWALFALSSAVYWLRLREAELDRRQCSDRRSEGIVGSRILSHAVTWTLTALFTIQALLFFGVVTFLPRYLSDVGGSVREAAFLLAFFSLAGIISGAYVPVLMMRIKTGVWLAVLLAGVGLLGFLCLALSGPPVLATAFLGIGQAGIFPLALTLFVVKSSSAGSAAALSAMAQSVGFALAGVGLVVITQFVASGGDWSRVWFAFVAFAGLQAVLGGISCWLPPIGVPAAKAAGRRADNADVDVPRRPGHKWNDGIR